LCHYEGKRHFKTTLIISPPGSHIQRRKKSGGISEAIPRWRKNQSRHRTI